MTAAAPPWTLRLFSRTGLPAPLGALCVFAGYWAVLLAGLALLGRAGDLAPGAGPPWGNDLLWDNLVSALLCAYFGIVTVYGLRGTERDLEALRPVIPGGEAGFEAARSRTLAFDARRRRIGAALAVVIAAVLQVVYLGAGVRLDDAPLHRSLHPIRIAVITWFAFHAIHFDVSLMRALFRLGRRGVEVRLFEPESLAPFSRHGLRAAFLWFVACGAFSLFTLGDTSGLGDLLWLSVLVQFATANLVVPVLGVHARLREEKRAELAKVRSAITRERGATSGAAPEDPSALAERLAPLLTLEARLEHVREWPFDAYTLVRFFLYAAFGIGSWLGAALVERGLGVVLD